MLKNDFDITTSAGTFFYSLGWQFYSNSAGGQLREVTCLFKPADEDGTTLYSHGSRMVGKHASRYDIHDAFTAKPAHDYDD